MPVAVISNRQPIIGQIRCGKKHHTTNLLHYKQSQGYFARLSVKGKLIRRNLKIAHYTVVKLRLGVQV